MRTLRLQMELGVGAEMGGVLTSPDHKGGPGRPHYGWPREKRKREKIQERKHSKGTQRIAGADTPQKQQIASLLQCRVFAVSQYRRGAAGICEQPSCDWCNLNGAATSHRRRRVAISGGVTSASASNSPFLRRSSSFAR
ncbi:hypothetical protein ACJJTC_003940 [Scirpophaga incertulas]